MKVSQSVWLIAACLLLGGVGTARQGVAAELPDVIDSVRPGIVGIGTVRPARRPFAKSPPLSYRGTGFAVGSGLLVITNHHVIPEELDTASDETIAVFTGRGEDSQVRPAVLVRSDPTHDVALLRIEGEPLPALKLAAADARVREGEAVAFTGFPIGMVLGLYPVTHRGIVSVITPAVFPSHNAKTLTAAQLKRMRTPFDVYQLDAVAYPGNSGSPVYRQDSGVVIGVINSVFVKETKEAILEKPSGISYAIPVRYVHELLEAR